jgi:hypothetical protein
MVWVVLELQLEELLAFKVTVFIPAVVYFIPVGLGFDEVAGMASPPKSQE